MKQAGIYERYSSAGSLRLAQALPDFPADGSAYMNMGYDWTITDAQPKLYITTTTTPTPTPSTTPKPADQIRASGTTSLHNDVNYTVHVLAMVALALLAVVSPV